MAQPSGLSPSLRLDQPHPEDEDADPINVVVDDGPEGDTPKPGLDGKVLEIEHPDGSITVSLDGRSLTGDNDDKDPLEHFSNIVDEIDEAELSRISDDLLRGVESDKTSRVDWIQQRTDGIKLLALTLEVPAAGDSGDGAAVEGMSRIRHPLLLEAVLRFQANARSELLPTDGPVKIRDDDNNSTQAQDSLADCLEKDFNHYLTATASEYYPDTDRMLLLLGFGGLTFKKIYFCPLRNRPVSESVDADDLIVNNAASDLRNAKRITHSTMMKQSTVKRLQLLGVYRDVGLATPMAPKTDDVKQAKKDQQGVQSDTERPEDRDREIYEIECELDIRGFEHQWKGKPSGLEIPWRVTVDFSSKQVLSVVRNYDEEQANKLPEANCQYVAYTFIPGLGFYGIGLLHILGNATNAVTAAWRELLDMGMFANFPGFLYAKGGQRQQTNTFRIPPGGGAPVDTQGMPIRDAILPLPYNAQGMPALMSLAQDIVQTGQRVGSTAEMQVAEGRADVPVGTIMAQIEQAQKIINSVHKRLHASQAEEFQKLKKCFRDHPESFWQCNKKPAKQWDEQTLVKALDDCNLVPQADPNTASHLQRMMKVQALSMLQDKQPGLYDTLAMERIKIEALGFSNPDQFFAPPEAQGKPPPEIEKAQAELAIKKQLADATTLKTQTDAQAQKDKQGLGAAAQQLDETNSDVDNKVKIVKAQLDGALKNREIDQKDDQGILDEKIQLIDAAQNLVVHPEAAHLVEPLLRPAYEDVKRREAEMKTKRQDPAAGLGAAAAEIPE